MRYQIRELSLGGILDQAIALTKNHFGQFLALTSLALVTNGGFVFIEAIAPRELVPMPPFGPQLQPVYEPWQLGAFFGLALVSLVLAPLTNAAIVNGVAQAYLGRPISFGDAMGRSLKSIMPLMGTWLLMFLFIWLGTIACLVPGIILAFRYALATQVAVLENVYGMAALSRSKELMKDNYGTFFVLGFMVGILGLGLHLGAGLIPDPYAKTLMTVVVQSVVSIVSQAAFVVFYFSCRCKHEAFDLQLLAEAVGADHVEDAFEINDAPNS